MKLQESGNTALLTGGLTSPVGSFKINTTAKAFHILSSGLYTDKIKAIIRELSCNALDAHTFVGTPEVPFEVHLPNSFEPYLKVSDNGPGLSEEDIYELYVTYFSSTKQDSNEFLGVLGLGSKSPFSYSQTFTVTSRHGGFRKVYSAFLTDEGMPSIVKMSEEPYDGSTGLDVQMAVKSGDFYVFQSKATDVFTYFPTVPKIIGAKIDVVKPIYTTKGTGWAIRRGGGGARAIQGAVAYPIPATNDPQADELLRLGVDLFFSIGELEVAASREALSMNKTTSRNLAERIKLVVTEIGAEVSKSIESAPTQWEAVRLYQDMMRNQSIRSVLKNVKIKWHDIEVQDFFEVKNVSSLSVYACEKESYGRGRVRDTSSSYISPKDTILVKNDLPRGSKGVLNRWVREFGEAGHTWVLVGPGRELKEQFAFADTQAAIDDFFYTVLGNPPEIKLLSAMKAELPKAVVTARNLKKSAFQTFNFCHSGGRWGAAWNEASDDDLEGEEFFYIETHNNSPVVPMEKGTLRDLMNIMIKLGLVGSDDKVFNGSPRFRAELKKLPIDEQSKWINLYALALETAVLTEAERQEIDSVVQLNLYNMNLISPDRDTLDSVMQRIGITDQNAHIPALADIKNAYAMHFKAITIVQRYQARMELARVLGRDDILIKTSNVPMPNLSAVTRNYSLLTIHHYADWQTFRQTVELIELLHAAGKI